MKPSNWKQWLKLTEKQLRQLGRTIDQELGHVLNRNLPSEGRRMLKVPIPVRHTPKKFHLKSVIQRNFHQFLGNKGSTISRPDLNRGGNFRFIQQRFQPVSLYSTGPRIPKGTPRGLYTNWNMSNLKFANQRMYSTASINFTHEAAANIGVSLRCLFTSLENSVPTNQKNANLYCQVDTRFRFPKKLTSRALSTIRDVELFEMIINHKEQSFFHGDETVGSVVEFKVPMLNIDEHTAPVTFINSAVLGDFQDNVLHTTRQMNLLEDSLRKIHDMYGSLPMTFDKNKNIIALHFPNSTMKETEALITELGITLGCVCPYNGRQNDQQTFRHSSSFNSFDSVLSSSNSNSMSDMANEICAYSSIISSLDSESFLVV